MKPLRTLLTIASILLSGCASRQATPQHLVLIRQVLSQASPENISYQHRPTVVALATDQSPAQAHADCSGLVNAAFQTSYGWSDAQLLEKLGAKRPIVKHYADAIEQERGFRRITDITQVRPGDILASPYKTANNDSGHMMIVDEIPHAEAADFTPAGLTRLVVRVIDSTSSRHGPPDSRTSADGTLLHTGLGTGVISIYCREHVIVGYSWGTSEKSHIWMGDERPLFIGRLIVH